MRLRQLAILVEDLNAAAELIRDVFGLSWWYRDPAIAAFGMDHVVMPIGGEFLEILAPIPGVESTARGYLTRRGGDTGYMVILHAQDPLAHRERLVRRGVRVVHQVVREPNVAVHYHPRDTGGVLLDINGDTRTEDVLERLAPWPHCGPDWQGHADDGLADGILGVTLESDDPDRQAAIWAALVDQPSALDSDGVPVVRLAGGYLRFVESDRGAGLRGVDIKARDRSKLTDRLRSRGVRVNGGVAQLCGCEFRLF